VVAVPVLFPTGSLPTVEKFTSNGTPPDLGAI
jgi:hypothetical protein